MNRSEDRLVDNFIYSVQTQAERGLDGQDPGEMAEALRAILQACGEARRRHLVAVAPALPSQTGVPRELRA
jgi:hypothetical protein